MGESTETEGRFVVTRAGGGGRGGERRLNGDEGFLLWGGMKNVLELDSNVGYTKL